jgi:hypothetical protein
MKDLFNTNKLMDRFFRKVDSAVWDLMTGRIGIKTKDGIVTVEGEGEDAVISLNMLDQFGIGVPAFAQNTAKTDVRLGDMIFGASGPLGWVTAINEKSFGLLKPDGTHTTWSPQKVQMFGFDSGVMVLRSLLNMLPGGSAGLAGFQGSMLPMLALMGGDDGADDSMLSQMMPMMLMSQMGMMGGAPADGSTPAANPMAQMMPMMLMMKMMGGKGGTGGKGFFD